MVPLFRFQKENTPFRKGKSKEELLRNTQYVLAVQTQALTAKNVLRIQFVVLSWRRANLFKSRGLPW